MNIKNYDLFLDMDDVLVNLSKEVIRQYNKDFNDCFNYNLNSRYWWGDCPKANKDYFQRILNKQGTFLNAEPIENAIEIVSKLYNEGFNIHILTTPQYNTWCVQEKIQWIQKHLPFIDINKNVHFSGNKGLLSQPNRILLDDNLHNLIPFYKQGGISIIFNQGWNQHEDIKGSFDGYRISDFHTFYDLVHTLESKSFRLKYEL